MQYKTIHFSGSQSARAVIPVPGTSADAILEALDIGQPEALLIVIGGASNMAQQFAAPLAALFSQGIALAAAQTGAMIIDGGTHTGVMELMGQGVVAQGNASPLLGVTAAGLVTYPGAPPVERPDDAAALDPNHSHFVLVDTQEWDGVTATLFALARSIARDIPAIAILVNGGSIACNEALEVVRSGWPLLVIEDSGHLADEIAALWRSQPATIVDEKLREIIARGNISLFSLHDAPDELPRHIVRLLGKEAPE